jgi:hypothetical protein
MAGGGVLHRSAAHDAAGAVPHPIEQIGADGGEEVRVAGDIAIGGKGRERRQARIAAVLVDFDQPMPIGKGLTAKERRIDDAERRRVRADSEAEDQDRRNAESPVAPQPARRVPDLTPQVVEGSDSAPPGTRPPDKTGPASRMFRGTCISRFPGSP